MSADKATIRDQVEIVFKRANSLAPNSNFNLDGFDGVKFRMVIQALLENFAAQASTQPSAAQTNDTKGA